ncbi:MAG: hypothetical protein EKK48_16955 [Candidatus Melainabacteria bacterium]|nr:MAG: hypothetical protein EKK48_16955 [Candidatus Melainabacteria bacterium]
MSVEYKHCLAIADLSWLPRDEADFQSLEKRLDKVLTDHKLVEACVEKRTGQSRQIRLTPEGEIGDWKEGKQAIRHPVHVSLHEERRYDWKPEESQEEIQWICLQLGPNFKVYDDPYGQIERVKEKGFHCAKCSAEVEEKSDPWFPQMLDGFAICQATCNCGGEVLPATITLKSKTSDPAPNLAIWKACLVLDFGGCETEAVLSQGKLKSQELRKDLEAAFGQSLVEFGAWY